MNEILNKIGIFNLFEAILYTPKSYTNTFLITNLSEQSGALRVRITDKKKFNKILKLRALMLDFDSFLEINIFSPKPFHSLIFRLDKEIYILGKLEFNNAWQMNQPKIINNINQILMNFPTIKIKQNTLNEVFKKIINKHDLKTLGLDAVCINAIYEIFHPNKEFVNNFQNKGGFFGIYLEALKFVEIYYYMQGLKSRKREFIATNVLNGNYLDFIKSLPFSLTKGQSNCIDFLKSKLSSNKATRCVVMGDVGCGKTIIILTCVMMAYPKKSLLLAPTTILANQLYVEAKKFLPKNVRIEIALKDSIINDCDFLIGTHTLLYRELSEFDLFMTDEQHRFGTNQRLRLEQMLSIEGKKPHCIQFSATPIPRTMAMIESNLVDFCFIKDLPFKKDITTKIITKKDFNNLLSHIKNDIKSNKQVAIIYPLVEKSDSISYQSIEEGKAFWQKNFSNVYFTHGKDKMKEEILEEFRDKGSLLIATTLFEVGISLPRLSSIIIVGAERLGFATLHQLRGRVSRNGMKGYCFLYTNNANSLRLKDFVSTISGFEIAELDLKYRNSGDILRGVRQSGEQFKYFDMYEDKKIAFRASKILKYH
ncbi:ATP-dependent DNA helicase RecG [Helicobacter sp. MIT 14-3879]|uniref:ATP-dependent DNA helicase RecG n=1 Tax=Helicobacter sp. MIT 14-3879 TaxID=2040649 RepID=UPI000E1F56C8|nr:ATP-dependent DNA helicase RecG [Helicobacter sp. MIT 14-3879]RDU64689.1 ATP-dependent DNA helicase RecG [Helicobacter sp. MIT 14-3879]